MAEAGKSQSEALPGPVIELISAVSNGQLDHVVRLLDSGNISIADASVVGFSALHYAAVNNRVEILQVLIRRGFKCDSRDNLGYTPLHLACAHGHRESVSALLEASSPVNSQDHVHGNTAVHEAAWNGFSESLQLLIRHNANVNIFNKTGFSALHLSAQNGHNECSRILLFAGCSLTHTNDFGDNALHTAARYGHAGVTRILLIAKCRINEQNRNGDTALHIAAALKFHKITKMLLQAGVDTNIRNTQNETAIDVARRKEHEEIYNLLRANPSVPAVPKQRVETVIPAPPPPAVAPSSSLNLEAEKPKPKKQKWSLFSKKSKTKQETLPSQPAANIQVPTLGSPASVRPAPQPTLSAMQGGGQTVSINPDMVLRSFQLHQMQKHRELRHGATGYENSYPCPVRPAPGYFNHNAMQGGVQYYRDLAGNIKQGPVGYIPETSRQQPQFFQFGYDVPCQAPVFPGPQIPAMNPMYGTLHNQRDHLSYLRNRNLPLPTGAPQMPGEARYVHTYEQPAPQAGYRAEFLAQRFPSTHGPRRQLAYDHPSFVPPGFPGGMVRSLSDETLSTASSCQHPSVHGERDRNVRRHGASVRHHKSRTRSGMGVLANEMPDRDPYGSPNGREERFDRHHRLKKSQRSGQNPSNLRKKLSKLTSTSSESGGNSNVPVSDSNPSTDVAPSRVDVKSNPDSGYGGSKACLDGVTSSMHKLAISNSSSFQSKEDLQVDEAENRMTSSTDNGSVISSVQSGSMVSICNSL